MEFPSFEEAFYRHGIDPKINFDTYCLQLKKLYDTGVELPAQSVEIPKIIHQIWLGGPLPDIYSKWIETWKHAGWEYQLWQKCDFTLHNQKLFNRVDNLGIKSDILRLEILERYGGLYIDIDFSCVSLPFFDWAHQRLDLYLGLHPLPTAPLIINNGLLGAKPGHPFLRLAIKNLMPYLQHCQDKKIKLLRTAAAGPYYINLLWKGYCEKDPGRTVCFPPSFFYPSTREDIKDSKIHLFPETAAFHWWAGSWK